MAFKFDFGEVGVWPMIVTVNADISAQLNFGASTTMWHFRIDKFSRI